MSEIHAELPNEGFGGPPEGIVTATVCSRSGKLPIEGLCSGTLRTEYFAVDTVPTVTCDVHYAGSICSYSNLPACEGCPFKVEGVMELTPIENLSLQTGSAAEAASEDGSIVPTPQTNMCPHTAEFFANPDWEAVVNGQRWEIEQRNAAAAAAAAQQAADQQQQAQQQQQAEQPEE